MRIDEIIAELNGLAQEQAGAAHILETTRFEPELQALTPGAIADARRKAGACLAAIALLNGLSLIEQVRGSSYQHVVAGAGAGRFLAVPTSLAAQREVHDVDAHHGCAS